MKKAIKKLLLFSVLFVLCNSLNAQQGYLSVDTLSGFPGTAYFDSTYIFDIVLRNNDSTSPFSGPVYILCHTDTNSIINDTIGANFQVNIPADTITNLSVTGFSFDPSIFRVGGNVVVIWPVNSNGQIMVADTFHTNIVIMGYAGISDIELPGGNNNVFPVPANDMLFLPQNITKNSIEYVRIMDMLGRQKYFSSKAATSINTSFLEQGVYFIEIKEKNKTPKVLKFVISR